MQRVDEREKESRAITHLLFILNFLTMTTRYGPFKPWPTLFVRLVLRNRLLYDFRQN